MLISYEFFQAAISSAFFLIACRSMSIFNISFPVAGAGFATAAGFCTGLAFADFCTGFVLAVLGVGLRIIFIPRVSRGSDFNSLLACLISWWYGYDQNLPFPCQYRETSYFYRLEISFPRSWHESRIGCPGKCKVICILTE